MKLQISNLFLFAVCWALALILPHFQNNPNLVHYVFDMMLCVAMIISLRRILLTSSVVPPRHMGIVAFWVLSIFPVVYMLLRIGFRLPYETWSRFGAGSMILKGNIIPFGDLIHLTSAAKCPQPIEIGEVVCDLWGRPLNQNPLIISLMRNLRITNIEILGLASYLLFAVVIIVATRQLVSQRWSVYIFVLTPPLILASDRGNELITISLIILGMFLLNQNSLVISSCGAFLLSFSVIFKLWPLVLVFCLIVTPNKFVRVHVKLILILSALYWIVNYQNAFSLLEATQNGSPFGNSFGLQIFWSSNPTSQQRVIPILIALAFFIFWILRFPIRSQTIQKIIRDSDYGYFLLPVFFTYFVIWLAGDSFSYRMIILLPAVLILSQEKVRSDIFSGNLLLIILFTALTARLPIFSATSSAAALYFGVVILIAIAHEFKQASTLSSSRLVK